MPRYDYRCGDCGEQFEVVQSFDEAPLDTCPHCGGAKPRKLFGNVGVVFKGSGFYRNDSREASKSGDGKSSDSKSDSSSKSDAGDKKSTKTKSPESSSKSDAGKKEPSSKSSSSTTNAKSSEGAASQDLRVSTGGNAGAKEILGTITATRSNSWAPQKPVH